MLRNFRCDPPTAAGPSLDIMRWVDWENGKTTDQAVMMPAETLSIRAGEYGLNLADPAMILDVVLLETFIVYPDDDHPLWHSDTLEEARTRHLDTVATMRATHAGRNRRKWTTAETYEHEQVIGEAVAAARLHPAISRMAATMVERQREIVRTRPALARSAVMTDAELVAHMRRSYGLDRPTRSRL